MSVAESANWRRSRRCEANTCVEIAHAGEQVMFRDSADLGGPVLTFSRDAWETFAAGVHSGDFDLTGH